MTDQRNAVKIVPVLALISATLLLAPPLFSLTVTLDDNYPPYSFRDSDGHSQGILIDLWALWSQKTGVPVTLLPLPWSEALKTMAQGKADVLDTVFQTPSRSLIYDFTAPYASIRTAVYNRDGLAGILELKDLKGYLVGIKAGDAGADVLRASGVGLREFPSYEAVIDAASRGEIHVFCMDVPPALHFLYAKGLSSRFRQAFVLSEDSFHRAVPKDHVATLVSVSQGFNLLSQKEIEAVEARWLGAALPDLPPQSIAFTIIIALAVVALVGGLVFFLGRQIQHRSGQLAGTEARLRLSEDWGRALAEALPDLLFILDSTGLVLECRAPTANSDYTEPERYVGKRLVESFSEEMATMVAQKMAVVEVSGGVGVVEVELTIRDRKRTFEGRIVRMADGRFLIIVRDLTDSRMAWKDDLQRNKLESLGVLAGGLAHDFNNNLAVIQGFVSLARVQLKNPDKALASLDKAVAATRRAAGLTSQLRVLAHGSEVHRKHLSVRELAEEAASFALVGSPCLLAVEVGDGPWIVEADPDQLSQVFHNLVLNAVQAMPRGGTVTLVFRRKGADHILVAVVDEGTGISQDDLPRIFDPYFTTKPKGTGLGLSVVHAVVERHGGTIEVDSRIGRGTVFTVALAASHGAIDNMEDGNPPADPTLRGQRVLLMEDEGDLRDLMVHVLTSLGLEPLAYRNGREALEAFDLALAEGRPFPLVVSDLLVPGDMGGREMISLLRTRPGSFKALAVTGFSTERSTEDFYHQGFDVIVGKPFTVDELKARIVELMKSPWKTASTT